jgi:hypothetical protein
MADKRIELGDEVQDLVSGVKGIAIGRTTWITGCDHIQVKPQGATAEGLPRDSFAVDEPMLKIIKKARVAVPNSAVDAPTKKGGPGLAKARSAY